MNEENSPDPVGVITAISRRNLCISARDVLPKERAKSPRSKVPQDQEFPRDARGFRAILRAGPREHTILVKFRNRLLSRLTPSFPRHW